MNDDNNTEKENGLMESEEIGNSQVGDCQDHLPEEEVRENTEALQPDDAKMTEECEADDDANEDDDDDLLEDDDEDGGGWITPSNISKVKKKMGCEDEFDDPEVEVKTACLTTDFAMQVRKKHLRIIPYGVNLV